MLIRNLLLKMGTPLALAALLLMPLSAWAQKGGGHGGGGHGGGGHGGGGGGHMSGGFHSGGSFHTAPSSTWHGGTWNGGNWNGNWHGGNWNGGHWNNGWGGFGWGFALGLGLGGYPYWAYDRFGPGVWIGSYDYPGYFSYYGDDGYMTDGTYYAPLGEYASAPTDVPQESSMYADQAQPPSDNRAYVTIRLPNADARVWIEDEETKDRGRIREFRSPVLEQGHSYTYDVRAEWKEGDQIRKETKKFPVRANDHIMVVFGGQGKGPQARPPANLPEPRPEKAPPPVQK